jgi:hypothetical protein
MVIFPPDPLLAKVVTRGRLNTTSHQSVLTALTHRGLDLPGRLLPGLDGHHAWLLDETGKIATDGILCVGNELCYNEVERNEVTEINKLDLPKEILTLHGSTPPKKPDGII